MDQVLSERGLRGLYRLTEAVGRASSLEEICECALDCLAEVLEVRRASILLADAGGRMRFKCWRGLSEAYRVAVDGHSPWAPDERNPRPVLVPDVEQARELSGYRELFQAENIRALGFIPLCFGEQLLGKFMVYYGEPHCFSDTELDVAKAIAAHVAFVIERAHRLEAEHRARARAEAAVRAREDILGIVAHDLRNPLSIISMKASLMVGQSEAHSEPRAEAEIILRSTRRMEHLIRDLLDFSQIEAGRLTIDPAPHPLGELLKLSLESVQAGTNPRIELNLETCVAQREVRCDRERMLQIMENLLSNAVKFTPADGRVLVRATADENSVVVCVEDSGQGIAPEDLERVFDRYWQSEAKVRRRGVGLGLFIAKALVEAQGGRIWVDSVAGQGSKFFFSVPVKEAELLATPAYAAPATGSPESV